MGKHVYGLRPQESQKRPPKLLFPSDRLLEHGEGENNGDVECDAERCAGRPESTVALGVVVVVEGAGFVFRSPEIDKLTNPHEVDRRTAEWVEVFNGMSRIEEGDSKGRSITVGGLARDHGTRKEYFVIPGTGEYRSRFKDLGPRNFPAWSALAARDEAVDRALLKGKFPRRHSGRGSRVYGKVASCRIIISPNPKV